MLYSHATILRDEQVAAGDFYSPHGIDAIHAFLRRGMPMADNPLEYDKAYVRNIGYNLQYLEYLSHTIDEHLGGTEPLHVTVLTLTYKTFVITGMGIVEAILWYLLKRADQHSRNEWGTVSETTNEFTENGREFMIVTTIRRKLDAPQDVEMSLDHMTRRVEKKKLLGVDGQVYKDLNHLRKLRNRVHIHDVQHDKDTDWWKFSNKDVKLMKGVLNSILRSELFKPEDDYEDMLAYLKVEEPPEKLADDISF
jgi:hypothetical protein